MAVVFANNAKTTLASSVSTSATSISVVDGSVFPAISGSDYTYVTFEDTSSNVEVVKVTARSGNTLTVVRGQDGTSATAYSAGDKCELRITAALLNDLNTEADTESVSRDGDTMTGNLSFGDNNKALFGAGSDLQIYHDGSASYIDDSGEGDLVILSSARVRFEGKSTGDTYMRLNENSSVQIYHDNTARLTTTSTGIDVTGIVDASDLVRFGVNNSEIANNYVRFKPSGAAYIDHSTVGQAINFRVSGSSSLDTNALTISSTGIEVSGTVTADGDGLIQKSTGAKLQIKSTTNFISPNDVVGSLDFVSADYNYTAQPIKGQISSVATNPSGTGESALFISTTETTNLRNRIKIDYNGDISFYDTDGTTASFVYDADAGLTINEGGADRDFRVESDNNAHMLYVNASNDRVSIGTNTRSAVLTIQSAGNGYSTGSIALKGAGISDTNYLTNAGGNFYISHNGTYDDFVLKSGDLILNESGMDRDFRVESDSDTHALFVNGENGRTGLGVANPQASLDVKSRFLANHNDGHAEVTIASTSNRQPSLTFKEGTSTRATLFTAAGSNDLTLDVAGDINLDADSGAVKFLDGGTGFGEVFKASSNMVVYSSISNGDIKFMGNDGGSNITALTLDMSAAGAATFNAGITSGGKLALGQTTSFPTTGLISHTNNYLYMEGGSNGIILRSASGGTQMMFITPAEVVVNNDSADIDFRVESNGNANMLFVDGGANNVFVGGTSTTTAPSGGLGISASGEKALVLQSTAGDTLAVFKDSGTGSNPPYLGSFGDYMAFGRYGGGTVRVGINETSPSYPLDVNGTASIRSELRLGSSSSDPGILSINDNSGTAYTLAIKGTGTRAYTFEGSSSGGEYNLNFNNADVASGMNVNFYGNATFNQNGNDFDFRVESSGSTHALFVDGGNDRVGLFTSAPSTALDVRIGGAGTTAATVASGTGAGIFLENNATAEKPYFVSKTHNPGNSTAIGGVKFATSPDGLNYNWAGVLAENSASGNAGRLRFYTSGANNSGDSSTLRASIIENGFMGLGLSTPLAPLHVQYSAAGEMLRLESTDAGGALGPIVGLYRNSASPAAGDNLGAINFYGEDTAGNITTFAAIESETYGVSNGAEAGRLHFKVCQSASLVSRFYMNFGETVVNESSENIDFRVESNDNANMIFVDAGSNEVGIGTGNPGATFDVAGSARARNMLITESSGYATMEMGGPSGAFIDLKSPDSDDFDGRIITFGSGMFLDVGTGSSLVLQAGGENRLEIDAGGEIAINETGIDRDFRVESNDNTHMLFVDAGLNGVGIGTSDRISSSLTIQSSAAANALSIIGRNNGSSDEAVISFYEYDGTTRNAYIIKEAGQLVFVTGTGGAPVEKLRLGTTSTVVNEGSADQDFRVESDGHSSALMVNAAENTVSMHSSGSHSMGSGSTTGTFFLNNNYIGHTTSSDNAALILRKLTYTGTMIRFYQGTSIAGQISTTASGISYQTTSDRRLKKDIETITDGTDKLMAMNPVTHGWKADPEADAVHGFIAQEMMDIVPEAVAGDPESDEMMSMDYGRITPVIVAALQDAIKEIQELKTRINELEGK